jgi:hypothetical protein
MISISSGIQGNKLLNLNWVGASRKGLETRKNGKSEKKTSQRGLSVDQEYYSRDSKKMKERPKNKIWRTFEKLVSPSLDSTRLSI